jgi:hypothetical protein
MPLAGAVIGGVASIGGALISSNANSKAAEKASQAQLQGAREQIAYLREAADKNEAFAREGQDYLKDYRATQEPGESYLRGVIADPGSLTPAQAAQLEELRRQTRNQISTSAIAGSGRTAAALLKKTESDFTNDALDRNKARADMAASGMATRSGNAATTIGNISVGLGSKTADLTSQMGQTQGAATKKAGEIEANGITANGNVIGQTLGNLGSIVANETRSSRYA